jgi:hypothetical protein
VAGDAHRVADELGPQRRLDAVAADHGDAAVDLARRIDDGDAALVLLDALDAGRGLQLDAGLRLHALEQGQVDVGAMDHRVRVAEALQEGGAGRDLADEALVHGVHHHHALGVHGAAARALADAERVEGGEGVRCQLDAGADLAELRRLLEDPDGEAASRQGQRGRQAADAGAGDDDRALGGHGVDAPSSCALRARARAPAGPGGRRS